MAAGIAEGYLTRISIIEQYKEKFLKNYGDCESISRLSDQEFCIWLWFRIVKNRKFVKKKIQELADSDPYWHQINLLYLQMEGLTKGYQLRLS